MIEILMEVHHYLERINQQFEGKLIEQEELDDLLDNLNDLPDDLETLETAIKNLNNIEHFSKNYEAETEEEQYELENRVAVYQKIGNIGSLFEDIDNALSITGASRRNLLKTTKDDDDFYQFGKASLTYDVEDNEEMEMVSKEGMADLRQELFELRKYKYETEQEEKIDPKELEEFKEWKKQQDEFGF